VIDKSGINNGLISSSIACCNVSRLAVKVFFVFDSTTLDIIIVFPNKLLFLIESLISFSKFCKSLCVSGTYLGKICSKIVKFSKRPELIKTVSFLIYFAKLKGSQLAKMPEFGWIHRENIP
jgi:hypothetical protein